MIRSCMAKAGAALRSVGPLYSYLLPALLEPSATRPCASWALARAAVTRVEVSCGVEEARTVLQACPALQELRLHLSLYRNNELRDDATRNLLSHRTLRLTSFSSYDVARFTPDSTQLLQLLAGVITEHSRSLESLRVSIRVVTTQPEQRARPGDVVDAFAAALASCTCLESASLPEMFAAPAFVVVARALAQCGLRSFSVDANDMPHYIAGVMQCLLPSLTSLGIAFYSMPHQSDYEGGTLGAAESAEALHLLTDGLQHNMQLRRLSVCYGGEMEAADVDAFHAALATTQISELSLAQPSNEYLLSLAAHLPPQLQSLSVSKGWYASGTLATLLLAAKQTHVTQLSFSECPWDDAMMAAVAALLDGNAHLRQLTLDTYGQLPSLGAVVDVLMANCSLQELNVGMLSDEDVRALACVLPVNSSLRSLSMNGSTWWGGGEYYGARPQAMATVMNDLAAALRCNSTLNKLQLCMRLTDEDDEVYLVEAVQTAETALRSVARARELLCVDISFGCGGEPGPDWW
jgi:hypothetical protein